MRILAYEHFSTLGAAAPEALFREGAAMLVALAQDLAAAGHEVTTCVGPGRRLPREAELRRAGVEIERAGAREPSFRRDSGASARRSGGRSDPGGMSGEMPGGMSGGTPDGGFPRLLDRCEAVWVVAPESGGTLEALIRIVRASGKLSLGCSAEGVAVAASKIRTARALAAAGVPMIPTALISSGTSGANRLLRPRLGNRSDGRADAKLAARARDWGFPLVLKPDDGVGSEGVGLARSSSGLRAAHRRARRFSSRVIVQPYVEGIPASVALILGPRGTTALALGRQEVRAGPRFQYLGGEVPLDDPASDAAMEVARAACEALPGLAGFVGVDLILAPGGPIVVELNPRLTTAYLGLRRACRENIADLVLRTLRGEVGASPAFERKVRFTVTGVWRVVRRNGARKVAAGPDLRKDGSRRPSPARTAPRVIGWDIGGANLKAVLLEAGAEPRALERPFEIWKAPGSLASELRGMREELGGSPLHAVTMSAELADCFASKSHGVRAVLDAVGEAFSSATVRVFGAGDLGRGQFLAPGVAVRRTRLVAGANWAAAAGWLVGERTGPGILLDVGSTTTDVIPFGGGHVRAAGLTDPERLVAGELVYTGALRTPICSLVRTLPLAGGECPVAAEHFAISADAHLWLGSLEPAAYTCSTPDGRPATRAAAGARLARMLCADREMLGDAEVTAIARRVAETQVAAIAQALSRVAKRLRSARPIAGSGQARGDDRGARSGGDARPVVFLAGSGAWLGEEAARARRLPLERLEDRLGRVARMLPAYAVACLAANPAGRARRRAASGCHPPARAGAGPAPGLAD